MNSNVCRSNYLNLGMTERDFSIAVMKYCCDSQDLPSCRMGVATVRETLSLVFSVLPLAYCGGVSDMYKLSTRGFRIHPRTPPHSCGGNGACLLSKSSTFVLM